MSDIEMTVLTGGPCGGKSSLLELLREKGNLGGRQLLFVPEAATILFSEGWDYSDAKMFQAAVLDRQLQLEDAAWQEAIALGSPCLIICDRGLVDGAAYCSDDVFDEILASRGFVREQLFDRYALVLHLVSAAIDAPDAYSSQTNTTRFEDITGAIAQEQRTMLAWHPHPNRLIFGGYRSFGEKLEAAVDAIEKYVEAEDDD